MQGWEKKRFQLKRKRKTLALCSTVFFLLVRSSMSFSILSKSFTPALQIRNTLRWRSTFGSFQMSFAEKTKYGRQKFGDSAFFENEPSSRDFWSGKRERQYQEVEDRFDDSRQHRRQERRPSRGRGGNYSGRVQDSRRVGGNYTPRDRASGWSNKGYNRNSRERSEESNVIKQEEGLDYIYGINPILNALKSQKRDMQKLYIQEGLDSANKKDKGAVDRLICLSQEQQIETVELDKHNLNLLSDNRPHQGFILQAKPLEFTKITELPPETELKVWLALDEVWDPQNFGALLRSAHFFGIDGVVTCAKNSAKLTPAVSKASAGACEAMEVFSANNMMRFMDASKKNGWQVVGLSLDSESVPLSEVKLDRPTILALGNEGHGLRTNILRQCETLCKINGVTDASVDSLNVSVTGGIILHHFVSQR
mmetsp:Transcript_25067/g.32377  ORF Transcript_25067/g.32377 Transcript_25067/m.32377 type:complete len:423 (-) Transcript_25067:437-1705(-)